MDQVTVFSLDLNEYYCQLSYFREGEKEAISISPFRNSEDYLIPTAVYKEESVSRWYVGQEALSFPNPICGFLEKAYRNENVTVEEEEIPARSLLSLYIRRVFSYANSVGIDRERDYFVFSVERANHVVMDTFFAICEELEINPEHVSVTDHKETLCYYMMEQEAGLRMYDVMLLDYWEKQMHVYRMHIERKVSPQVVTITETGNFLMEPTDDAFYEKLNELLDREHMLSAVYLVGSGFDGEWMDRSLSRLCTGRRVFFGMNLYTKGACYYGMQQMVQKRENPSFVYLGGGNILSNVCIEVIHQEDPILVTILTAGVHWKAARGSVEVLLAGDDEIPQLTLSIRPMAKAPVKSYYLPLPGLHLTKERRCRVRISAQAISRKEFKVLVEETGFGEIVPNTQKKYPFTFAF